MLMACTPKDPAAASFAALMMMVNVGYAAGVGVTGIWATRWGASTVLLAYSGTLLAIAVVAMAWWGMTRRSVTHQVA